MTGRLTAVLLESTFAAALGLRPTPGEQPVLGADASAPDASPRRTDHRVSRQDAPSMADSLDKMTMPG